MIHDERTKIPTDNDTVARRFQEQRLRLMSRRYEKKRKKKKKRGKNYTRFPCFLNKIIFLCFFFLVG